MSEHTPLTEADLAGMLRDARNPNDLPTRTELDHAAILAPLLAARTSTATADTGLRERVEALRATMPHSLDCGIPCNCWKRWLYDALSADATAAPTTDTGARYPRDTDSPALDWIDGARDE